MSTFSKESQQVSAENFEERTYRKVVYRIMPLLFVCYVVSYLDRVNVGFAKLQMLADLQFSESIYGIGAGIFFIGYFLFEVPSNLILYRVGPRKWIARIMITWGIASAAMMFVKTPMAFYVMRFILGVAEAGFFPGIILYMMYWFPAERRGRMTALFMTAVPFSGVIGGPLSGWILQSLSGYLGLAGWQWLFVLEGLPSLLGGLLIFAFLDDRVADAKWLSAAEVALLERNLAQDENRKGNVAATRVFSNPRVWLMAVIYFCIVMGLYGISFWLPTIIKSIGIKDALNIGLLTALVYGVATVGMILFGKSADRRGERRWHLVIPCVLASLGLIGSVVYSGDIKLAIVALSVAALGIMTALPLFWSCPTAILSGATAAGGIALINSIGNLSGFVSPYLVGAIKDATHSTDIGVYCLAGFLLLAAALVLAGIPARLVNRRAD